MDAGSTRTPIVALGVSAFGPIGVAAFSLTLPATRVAVVSLDPVFVDRDSVPADLEISAETDDGTVMGLRHREYAVEGVQFHRESILTASGHDLLRNFLAMTAVTAGPSGH